ncbi:MAG: hypothetical protein ACO3E3_04425 [Candidatus Limnocylindrus sp.]
MALGYDSKATKGLLQLTHPLQRSPALTRRQFAGLQLTRDILIL